MKPMMDMMSSVKTVMESMSQNNNGEQRSTRNYLHIQNRDHPGSSHGYPSGRRPNYTDVIMKSTSRSHMDVANRFKNKESKYGGADDENLQEYLDQYFLIADDCGLSATKRLQYQHNLFKGEALNFFLRIR